MRWSIVFLLFLLARGPVLAGEHALSESASSIRIDPNQSGLSVESMRLRHLNQIVIAAHRGFSAKYPENSVDAFEAAITAGTDLIETDVRVSADGVLFCHHDPDVEGREIHDTSSSDLDALGVARLSTVLSLARQRVGVLLDLKIQSEEFARSVLEKVRNAGMESQTIFGVRSIMQARLLRRLSKNVVLLGFLEDYASFPRFFEAGGDIARLWEEHLTPQLLATTRNGDHPVWITPRIGKGLEPAGAIDGPRLEALFQQGIDGVLVNDPATALALRRKFHAAARR